MKKKPDFETESLRMWVPDNREKKQYKKLDMRIKYKGYTFGLVGFTVVREKENQKIVFAFKFKPESKMVIAYLDDKNKELQEVYDELKQYAESMGYKFRDVRETWDRILMEEHTIKRLAKKADSKDQQVEGGG